ncbi:MAG: hypothetical protein ABFD97_10085, partial [Syntrophobacter sp.]
MNPRPRPEGDRRVMCAGYDACLDFACRENWPGFTCECCGEFRPLQKDEEEWRADGAACLALVMAVEDDDFLYRKRRGSLLGEFE